MHWDYRGFCDDVISRQCDGAVPCYTGYHPHLRFQDNLYASCKVGDNDNLIEIREKYAWHSDKTCDRHSPGIYYFKSGEIMKTYCQKMVDENDHINGEFYASLPYNYMVKDHKTVWCPTNVSHFCQWGTPEDVEDYSYWVGLIQKQRETQ